MKDEGGRMKWGRKRGKGSSSGDPPFDRLRP
jgi:hypothetical protein